MSLEQKIQELTDAIVVLNATLKTAAPVSTAPAAPKAEKPKAAPKAAAVVETPKVETPVVAAVKNSAITIAQIAEPLKALSNRDHAAALAIVRSFGVEKASLVAADKLPELLRKIELALNPGLEDQEAANPGPTSLI